VFTDCRKRLFCLLPYVLHIYVYTRIRVYIQHVRTGALNVSPYARLFRWCFFFLWLFLINSNAENCAYNIFVFFSPFWPRFNGHGPLSLTSRASWRCCFCLAGLSSFFHKLVARTFCRFAAAALENCLQHAKRRPQNRPTESPIAKPRPSADLDAFEWKQICTRDGSVPGNRGPQTIFTLGESPERLRSQFLMCWW